MIIHWPQGAMIALMIVGLTISLVQHGKPQGRFNFWLSAVSNGVFFLLLYKGGFFAG